MLDIIYKDNQLLVVNKPPGLPVRPDKTGDKTLQDLAEAYCHHPVHVAHHIDRPVSGLVLLAKNPTAMTALTGQFSQRTVDKEYLAVVQNPPPAPEGVAVHYLRPNAAKNHSEAFTEKKPGTQRAELSYRLLASSERYHLLLVRLITGRHHQIRAQLAALGCPVRGDVKYGFRRGLPDRSIGLHAWRLGFDHPVSGERLRLEAPLPDDPLWASFRPSLPH
jgi:23S rRNA pseudouridine1911/1915/1917 synthase